MIILIDADSVAEFADECSIAILLITRDEVERGTVGDVVSRLMAMSDSAVASANLAGAVTIMVDGYNDDPRDLSEIAEVREFFGQIHQQWSYWAHFLNNNKMSDSFNLLMSLLLKPIRQVLGTATIGTEYNDAELKEFLRTQVLAAARLCALHDLPPEKFHSRMETLMLSVSGGHPELRSWYREMALAGGIDF